MARKGKDRNQEGVGDYRHDDARRKNNLPAGIAPTYEVRERKTQSYAYDPLTGETQHTRGSDVAAWFLDTDYDSMTFHIAQAFFPGNANAWDKLQRALKAQIAPEAFEQMRGTLSFLFKPGQHRRIAVKVIDLSLLPFGSHSEKCVAPSRSLLSPARASMLQCRQ